MTATTRIGWIGCGVMGRWMLQHCMDAGYPAFVYSRTPAKCQPLLDQGAVLCSSPAEVARNADAIFSIVGYPKDVEEVMLGSDGILEGIKSKDADLRKKTVVVDMTTSKPELAERIASRLAEIGIESLDAPVSGGDIGAREGRLSIMVGGTDLGFNRVKDILQCMGNPTKGGKVQLVGGPGSGQHTKMANQILVANNLLGIVEALLYAQKAELDVEKTLQLVSGGAAGSWGLTNYGPRILKRNFDPGFFVEHFVKDMEIALDEARRMELSLPGLALCHQLYVALKAQGHGRKGAHALILALEHLNGIRVNTS